MYSHYAHYMSQLIAITMDLMTLYDSSLFSKEKQGV